MRLTNDITNDMNRSKERLIDVLVLGMLLVFAYLMRDAQPALAGAVVFAANTFWMNKNASAPHVSQEQATALAAAKVLETAQTIQDRKFDPDTKN